MNKIEFSKLEKKEDMQLAFNQLKDDYHVLFERHEQLKEVIEEVRELLGHFECGQVCECTKDLSIHVLQILDKVKGE